MTRTPPDPPPTTKAAAHPSRSVAKRVLGSVIRYFLPLVFVAVAVAAAVWLMRTSPRVGRRRRKRQKRARLVEVRVAQSAAHRIRVHAMGTVIPARRVVLHPQINGKVVWLRKDLVPGTVVAKGRPLLRIEARDYRLAVRQRESDLAKAQSALEQEKGRQVIAAKEYALLGKQVGGGNRALMLRKPQLEAAKAAVASARAALAKAKLDLSRTIIRAPFNATLEARHVNLGSRVNTATNLVTLVGTDVYWIEITVPVDQLRWIAIPQTPAKPSAGSRVWIYDKDRWGKTATRAGRVLRLLPGLEKQGRLARLLVKVKDPLALEEEYKKKPRLLIDAYLEVEIEGGRLERAVALDRKLLREDDTVWVLTGNDKLDIRPVTVAFRTEQQVFITRGLTAGERVVVTDLAAPVDEMPLRTTGARAKKRTKQPQKRSGAGRPRMTQPTSAGPDKTARKRPPAQAAAAADGGRLQKHN